MSARPGVTFAEEQPDLITFRGGTFSDEDVETWRFDFTGAKFRRVTVRFAPKWGKDSKGFLNDHIEKRVRQLIEEKYGKPKSISSANHRSYEWNFTDAPTPGASRRIEVFHWWSPSRRIGVTYSETGTANSVTSKAAESRIEELIERKNTIVEDIFGPLNNPVPASIREYLADLRENLLDEAAKKPVASSNTYDFGVRFCNGLISAYDERQLMVARLRNNSPSNAAGKPITMKDHPNWADYERERREARAATHDNKLETAFARNTRLQWAQRSEQLRKALDAFYAQFRQAARQPVAAKQ